ncbi:MAG: hypothetical protein N2050_03395 [Flavobacteriales bacterium]|nr:hypothetical protein [Flavobacteriales bacterium]
MAPPPPPGRRAGLLRAPLPLRQSLRPQRGLRAVPAPAPGADAALRIPGAAWRFFLSLSFATLFSHFTSF